MGNFRKPKATWLGLVKKYKKSGLSKRLFCEEQSININTLSYWLKKSTQEDSPKSLVKVISEKSSNEIKIKLRINNQITMEFYDYPDSAWLDGFLVNRKAG